MFCQLCKVSFQPRKVSQETLKDVKHQGWFLMRISCFFVNKILNPDHKKFVPHEEMTPGPHLGKVNH